MTQVSVLTGTTSFVRIAIVEGEEEIGHAFLFVIVNDNHTYGYVEDVHVSEAFRGKGFGRLLMAEIEVQAREFGCSTLRLTSNASRVVARNMYETLGFCCVSDGYKKQL